MNDQNAYEAYSPVEKRREALLLDKRLIEVDDFGAGSTVIRTKQRQVSRIAASSLKPRKYAQLLYRMVRYYKPSTILELGTSLGITTAYLSSGIDSARVFTCEGAASIAAIAKDGFNELGRRNIELIPGDFTQSLPALLKRTGPVDFAFIDGNHRKLPTLDYFEQILAHASPSAILVFDDIHWSREMEEAWTSIQQHPQVKLTIDLFFIGIVCISDDFKVRQQFSIAF